MHSANACAATQQIVYVLLRVPCDRTAFVKHTSYVGVACAIECCAVRQVCPAWHHNCCCLIDPGTSVYQLSCTDCAHLHAPNSCTLPLPEPRNVVVACRLSSTHLALWQVPCQAEQSAVHQPRACSWASVHTDVHAISSDMTYQRSC